MAFGMDGVPVGHTPFSWLSQGDSVPAGHTAFSWIGGPLKTGVSTAAEDGGLRVCVRACVRACESESEREIKRKERESARVRDLVCSRHTIDIELSCESVFSQSSLPPV